MIEILITLLVFVVSICLFLRGLGSLFKGIVFILFSLLLLVIFLKYLPHLEEIERKTSTVSRFLNVSYDRISSKLFSIRIVHHFKEGDYLYLVLENRGLFPLTKIEVYLDEEKAKIISRPSLLLPNTLTTIKLVYRDFSFVRVVSNNCEAIYRK